MIALFALLEWLAVAAATALAILAFSGAAPALMPAVGIALICASAARGLAFRRTAGAQLDGVLRLFRATIPGCAVNDDGRAQ